VPHNARGGTRLVRHKWFYNRFNYRCCVRFFLSVFFLRRPPSGSAFSLSLSSFYALVDFMLSVRIWRMLRMRPTSQTLLARERAKSNYTVRFPRIKYSRYTVTRIHFSTFWSEHSVRSETKLSKWNWRNLSLKKE